MTAHANTANSLEKQQIVYCQATWRFTQKFNSVQEAHEEAPEGQEEARQLACCPQPRLERKGFQEQGWSLEGIVHEKQGGKDRLQEAPRFRAEEQVDCGRDAGAQGTQAEGVRRVAFFFFLSFSLFSPCAATASEIEN